MSEISFSHFLEHEQDFYLDEFSANDSFSYTPHDRMMGPTPDFDINDFIPQVNFDIDLLGIDEIVSNNVNDSTLDEIERIHDVGRRNFELELGFVDQEHDDLDFIGLNDVNDSTLGVIERNHDVGLGNFGIELGVDDNDHVEFHHLVLELGLLDQEHDDPLEFDLGLVDQEDDFGDEFYVDRNRDNGIGNCDGKSSRDSGLRAIWSDSDSDIEFEGIGKHNHSDDEEDYNIGGSIDSKNCENGSRSCDGSSSRGSRLRPVWIESDSDVEVEVEVEGVDNHNHGNDGEGCNFGGSDVSNCENGGWSCDGSPSRISGVRAIWIDSDSDNEVEGIDDFLMGMHVHSDEEEDFGVENMNDDVDVSVPLCWDSFHLGEEEVLEEVNHGFEWEEVADGVDEREALSLMVGLEDEEGSGPEEDGEGGSRASNLEWEVLLSRVVNIDRMHNMENETGQYFGEHDDYTEYEMMFGQFADGENANLGKPPASKGAIEKLLSVAITKEDVADEKSVCAVCKDQIEVGEEGKKLPCSHLYHGDCIIPWLGIRNTCPVCRFELPTDDPDYEQRRTRRSARVA